ncbi:MAG: hypothetical protein H6765_02090 [Candidatus Peribacteria bacterium]|nr:MAG: hypothetical protein H6765_02090 [Candidatus Peribacteria bacterium]
MIKPYNYIAIDFETTGLDLEKDEPIQVGIVKFDHEWNITATFESLIRPAKDRKELRSIVTYLT